MARHACYRSNGDVWAVAPCSVSWYQDFLGLHDFWGNTRDRRQQANWTFPLVQISCSKDIGAWFYQIVQPTWEVPWWCIWGIMQWSWGLNWATPACYHRRARTVINQQHQISNRGARRPHRKAQVCEWHSTNRTLENGSQFHGSLIQNVYGYQNWFLKVDLETDRLSIIQEQLLHECSLSNTC